MAVYCMSMHLSRKKLQRSAGSRSCPAILNRCSRARMATSWPDPDARGRNTAVLKAHLLRCAIRSISSIARTRRALFPISSNARRVALRSSGETAFSWNLGKGYTHLFWMLDFQLHKPFIAEAVSLAVPRDYSNQREATRVWH